MRFCNNDIVSLWVGKGINPVFWQSETSKHHIIRFRINPRSYCDILMWGINEEYYSERLTFSFSMLKVYCYTDLNNQSEPMPSRMSSIHVNHYNQHKIILQWFKSDLFYLFFNCALAFTGGVIPYVKGCNSGVSQWILREQVVTCSGHSKQYNQTSLASTRGGAQ